MNIRSTEKPVVIITVRALTRLRSISGIHHGQVERRNFRALTPRDVGGSTAMNNVEVQGAIIGNQTI
ncbi:hypothetical protein ACGTN9_12885 [Halobacillus sp. MO56]